MAHFAKRKACFTFTWAIENAHALQFVGSLKSPEFRVKSLARTRWYLDIRIDSDSSINMLIMRDLEDHGPCNIYVDYEFSFLGSDGLPLIEKRETRSFFSGLGRITKLSRRQEVFVLRKDEFLPKDILTIRCRMWKKRIKSSNPNVCFARTRMAIAQHFFFWPITGFSLLQPEESRKRVVSSSEGGPKLTLSLSLTDTGDTRYVSLKIGATDEALAGPLVGEISVLNAESAAVHSEKIDTFLSGLEELDWISDCFFDTQRLLDDKSAILTKDTLHLRCELETFSGVLWSKIESREQSPSPELVTTHPAELVTTCPFRRTIHDFHGDGTLSDVTLRTDSESFSAHKLILSSRSPVFKAMFTHDMAEKSSKCIDLTDLSPGTLRHLLSYIYTNDMPEVEWQGAADLFQAADKYELLELKEKCAAILKMAINRSNVCSTLCLADMHRHGELLNSVLDFMSKNSDIFKSESWKLFKENNARLAMETMEQVICSVTNSN